MNLLEIPRAAAYGIVHKAHSAWTRRRYRHLYDQVERFCLFVGYPRSGHSIVGALLNAHKDAVISHELIVPPLVLKGLSRDNIYSQIITRANWFNMRGNTTNYKYSVPGQWQGRFETLRVVGDKRGGAVSRSMGDDPGFLQRVRELVGVPLRLIHVVRNPFDNIAAISIWHRMTLEEAVEFYFLHCEGTAKLGEHAQPGEVKSIHHEEFIASPGRILSELCSFLELEVYPGYLDDCCSVLFDKPTFTRRNVNWNGGLIDHVLQRSQGLPFLREYTFELPADRIE